MTALQLIDSISGIATAVGVVLAAVGLLLGWRQSRTSFEDSISNEYRQIIHRLPIAVLLDSEEGSVVTPETLNSIYVYIDFTNEQIFLRKKGRIRKSTWLDWSEGIKSNLSKPAFREAWRQIKEKSGSSFSELRLLEESGFTADPRGW